MLLAWPDPADYQERVAVASLLFAVCDFAIIREGVGLALRGGLASAWILVGLFAATGLIFAGRAALATTGHLGGPELFSPMPAAHQWLAVTGTVFLNLRGIILLLLAAERNRNLLLAQAQHDPLTGAMNRSGLERSVERLARPGVPTPGALLLIDIDHFKALNDTHGHDAGDKVLRLFTGVARAELRHGDVLARQGGDEFVVLVPGAGLAEAIGIAERIRRAFDDTLAAWTELRVRPTLSIGVTAGDLAPGQLDAALKTADDALYRSKRQGRNRVHALARDVEAAH
jgi:diguanylate cyclase (GGDEF)-like protein